MSAPFPEGMGHVLAALLAPAPSDGPPYTHTFTAPDEPAVPCEHDGEQFDVTTWGDLGNGVRRWLCQTCGGDHTVPTPEEDHRD